MRSRRRGGRGGKDGFEPRLRIRQREQDVIRLATEGRTQHDIAREVGLSQPAVSKLLRRVDERWMRANLDRVDRYKAEQHRRLEHLFREALQAWERSKAQHTRRRQRKTNASDPAMSGSVAEVIVDDSFGDPRYLEVARRALTDWARLWSVDMAGVDAGATDEPVIFTLQLGDRRLKMSAGDDPAASEE